MILKAEAKAEADHPSFEDHEFILTLMPLIARIPRFFQGFNGVFLFITLFSDYFKGKCAYF